MERKMAEVRNSEQGSRRRPARGGVSSAIPAVDDHANNGRHSNLRRSNNSNKNVGGGLWALLVFLLVYGPVPAQQQRGATLTAILVLVLVVLLVIPLVLYLRLSHLFPDHFSTHSLRASPHHPPWKPPPHTPRDWSWWQYHPPDRHHQNRNKPWLVFYNVYIPNETESQQHALGIISEQMKQVQESYAFTASKGSRLHLFYNTIGTDSVLTKEWIQQLFDTRADNDGNQTEMVVHHGQHYAEANEDVTLQDLYDFCNSPEVAKHEDDIRVIYLHSKGSFHYEKPSPNEKDDNNKPAPNKKPKFETQDRWRRLLTRAATHRYCLEQPNDNMVCDTCSLLMQPLPSVHYPGNMWSARASYIRKLLPPLGFDQRMDRFVVKQFTRFRDEHGSLLAGFFPQMPHMMGRKRFAPEHWLGSSPYLLHPCHLTPTANLSEWLHPDNQEGNGNNLDNNHLQMIPAYPAPGFPIEHAFWDFYRYGKRGETVLHNATLRLRDYFLLPGQIMKWYQLYGAVPPPESWVWKWFPDAGYWQEQIQQHTSKGTTGTLDDGLLDLWATKSEAGAVQ